MFRQCSCHTPDSLVADPHLVAVGLLGSELHPTEGQVRSIRSTVLSDGQVRRPTAPAQPIGSDTRAVLSEAGLTEWEIARLLESGAAHDGTHTPAGEDSVWAHAQGVEQSRRRPFRAVRASPALESAAASKGGPPASGHGNRVATRGVSPLHPPGQRRRQPPAELRSR